MRERRIKKIVKNVFARFGLFTVMRLSGLLLLPIWASIISPGQLAVIALLATMPNLFTTVCGLGYGIILKKIIFKFSLRKCHKYIVSFLIVRLLVGIVFGILLITTFKYINMYIFHDNISMHAWILMVCAGYMNIIISGFMSVARLKLYAGQFFILNFIYTVVSSWIFVFIACCIVGNYMASVYATFITFSFLACYSLVTFYLPIFKTQNIRLKIIRKYFLPSLPYYCACILQWIKTSIDSFIFSFLGLFPVLGILSMGKRVAGPYNQLLRSFSQPFEYIFAHDYERNNDTRSICEASNIFFIIMIFLIIIYDEGIRWYITLFVHKDYSHVISILIFLLSWHLLSGLQVFLARIALKNNNFVFSAFTNTCASILLTVSYVIFIPRYGLLGAVYSLVIVEALIGIGGSLFMRFRYKIDFYTLFKISILIGVFFIIIAVQNDIVLRIGSKIGIMAIFTLYLFLHKNRVMPQTVKIVKQYIQSKLNI